MVDIGVSEAIGEVLAVNERQDLSRESKGCRSVPDRDITSCTRAGVGCCSRKAYRQQIWRKETGEGDPPPIVNSGQVPAIGARSNHRLLASQTSSRRLDAHAHTFKYLPKPKFKERKILFGRQRDPRRALMPQDWNAWDRHVGPAVEGWRLVIWLSKVHKKYTEGLKDSRETSRLV
jgi:hypothetical protein